MRKRRCEAANWVGGVGVGKGVVMGRMGAVGLGGLGGGWVGMEVPMGIFLFCFGRRGLVER